MQKIRVMPNNLEAEESVLGSILIEPSSIAIVLGVIKTDDFYSEKSKIIWTILLNLYNRKTAIDFITVSDELKKINKFDELGGIVYLAELTSTIPTAINILHYAEIVKKSSMRRKIIKYGDDLVNKGFREDIDIHGIFSDAKRDLFNLTIGSSKLKPENFEELKKIPHEILTEKNIQKKKGKDYILQSQFGLGFERGSHIVIGALPSHGKSTIMLNILLDFAKQGYKVLYVNIEMTKKQVIDRIYAYLTGVDSTIFKYMDSDNILELLGKGEYEFGKFGENFYLLTSGTITSSDIASIVAEMRSNGGLDVHGVDYIGILSDKAQHKVEQMVIASNTLRSITKDFNTIGFVATQFSKEGYKAKIPSFAYVKDSQTIFDDADIALVLHRKKTQNEVKDLFPGECTHNLIIEKNRSGNTGTKRLNFTFNTLKFNLIED